MWTILPSNQQVTDAMRAVIKRNHPAYYRLIPPLSHSGENPLPPDDPNKELMGKTEVSLTLTNKFDVPGEANVEMDAKTLLLK